MSQPLTPRQQLFVEAYLRTRNAKQAARDARYSMNRAGTTGSELLRKPHIVEALRACGLEPPRGVHPRTQIRKWRTNRPRTGLSPREQRFALAYLVCGNAAESARQIGLHPAHASSVGARMVHRPHVAAFIEAERAASAERTRIDADRVRRELARIAFADIGDIAEWDEDQIVLKPSATISPDDRAAIAELRAKPGERGLKATIRMHSKQHALDRLAKLLGLFGKNPPPSVDPQARVEALKQLRQRLLRIARGEEGEAGEGGC